MSYDEEENFDDTGFNPHDDGLDLDDDAFEPLDEPAEDFKFPEEEEPETL